MSQNEVTMSAGTTGPSDGFTHAITTVKNKIGAFTSYINWIPMFVLFLMMLLTASDVIGRYVFNRPLYGGQDVTELGLVVMTFLAIGYMQFMKKHVQVELLSSRLSPRAQSSLAVFYYLLGAGYFASMSWQSFKRGLLQYQNVTAYKTLTIGFPTYPFMFIIAVGTFLLAFMVLMDMLLSFMNAIKR